MRRASLFLLLAWLLGLLMTPAPAVQAQAGLELRIDEIQSGAFPDLTLHISALDELGYPVPGLAASSFTLSEDGSVVAGFQVAPIQQHPVQVVIAIDTTQSMQYGPKPVPLQNTVQAVASFLGGLGAPDEAAVVAFGQQVTLLQDLTSDKAAAQAALGSLQAGTNTYLNDALVQAAGLLKGRSLRPVIIFVTDGSDSGIGQASFEQVLQAVQELGGVVFPIGWGGAKKADLEKLAGLSHGQVQFLQARYPDAAALQAAFSNILGWLPEYRTQYQLTFQSSLPADGKEHTLALGLDHMGTHLEQTRRFVATQGQIFLSFPTLSDGQTVGGKVAFAPVIDAPAPLQQIEIQVDGQPLTSLVAEPFTFEWDSTQVLPGEHEFKFVARDTAGNTGEAALKLNIVPPISVAITNLQGGGQVRGSVPITIQADALAKIARVELLVDGKLLATVENPPYEFSWPSAGAAEGGHEISVIAYDVNGYSASDSLRVTTGGGSGGLLSGPGGVALAIALAAAALMAPLALRLRRQRKASVEAGEAPVSTPEFGEVPAPAGAVLREVDGLNPGQVWALPPSGEVSLGRKREENDIPLKGPTASRRHAIIRMQEGRYILFNLRPNNPIYVNGNPVAQQCPLNPEDQLTAGESTFQFEQQG